jgi:hypothetical protein
MIVLEPLENPYTKAGYSTVVFLLNITLYPSPGKLEAPELTNFVDLNNTS